MEKSKNLVNIYKLVQKNIGDLVNKFLNTNEKFTL